MKEFGWNFVSYVAYDIRGIDNTSAEFNTWQKLEIAIWMAAQIIFWKSIFTSWK